MYTLLHCEHFPKQNSNFLFTLLFLLLRYSFQILLQQLQGITIIAILYVGTWDLFKMTILTFTFTFNDFLKFLFTCVDLFSSYLTLIHNGGSKFYFILF